MGMVQALSLKTPSTPTVVTLALGLRARSGKRGAGSGDSGSSSSGKPLKSAAAGAGGEGVELAQQKLNPLGSAAAAAAAAAPAAAVAAALDAPPAALYYIDSDGSDQWYVSAVTGESCWELPQAGCWCSASSGAALAMGRIVGRSIRLRPPACKALRLIAAREKRQFFGRSFAQGF
jgi:hypothetical protein